MEQATNQDTTTMDELNEIKKEVQRNTVFCLKNGKAEEHTNLTTDENDAPFAAAKINNFTGYQENGIQKIMDGRDGGEEEKSDEETVIDDVADEARREGMHFFPPYANQNEDTQLKDDEFL